MGLLLQSMKHPVAAFQQLQQSRFSQYWFYVLLIGIGSIYLYLFQQQLSEETTLSPIVTLILAIIFAIPIIWLQSVIFAFFLNITAKWLGGQSTVTSLRNALYISSAPYAAMVPVFIIWSFISPHTFFDDVAGVPGIIGTIWMFVLSVWSFILMLYTVAVAAQFSKWRAFFAGLIVFVCFILIAILIGITFVIVFM